jgi:hypothetical protein
MFRAPVLVDARSKANVYGRSPAVIVGSNPSGGIDVCCVLSGRGLCDELITRPEESYWLWRVNEEAIARAGLQSQRKQKTCFEH